MKNYLKYLVTIIFIFYSAWSNAQTNRIRIKIDSLKDIFELKDVSKKQRVETYLELGFRYDAFSVDSAYYYNNKAFELIKNDLEDKYFGRYYYNLYSIYEKKNDFATSQKYLVKSFPLTKKDDQKKWFYICGTNLANSYIYNKKFYDAEKLLFEIENKAKLDNSLKNLGRCYISLAYMYNLMSQKTKSFNYKLKAYNVLKDTKYLEGISKVTMMLAESYNEAGNFKESLNIMLELLKRLDVNSNLTAEIFYANLNTSSTYVDLKDFKNALKYANKTKNIADNENDKSLLFAANNLYANIYTVFRKYDLAINYHKKALVNIDFTKESLYDRANLNLQVSILYFKKGDFKNAELYYTNFSNCLKDKNLNDDILKLKTEAFTLKASIDSTKQDYVSEMKNFKAGVYLKDSLRSLEDLSVVESIKTKFKVAEKDNNIKVLDLKNKVQKAEINSQNQKTIFFIALSIIASILIGLLAYILKTKQKNNLRLDSKNNQLTGLLNDKELLLKEIHHRTKNNLQLLMSILKSQTRQIDKDSLSNFIQESQSRIVSMSLIHEALYNHDTSEISFEKYVHDLYNKINDVYNLDNQNIQINLNFNNINLDVQTSIILGLMLNELICNSFKYAFKDKDMGIINIDLNIQNNNQYSLQYSDNGRIVSKESTKTFGKQLIQSLAEQLSGNLTINHEKGIIVQMLFSDLKNSEVKYA